MIDKNGKSLNYKTFFEEYKITNSILLDFFDLILTIYYYDITTVKGNSFRTIDAFVSVFHIDLFENQKIKIELLLNFMTGDKWNLIFEKCDKEKINKGTTLHGLLNYDKIALLSGGLDTFCGVYDDVLLNKNKKILYAGYKINNIEKHSQTIISEFLMQNKNIDVKLFKSIDVKKEEYSQRTRSLLFFATGIVFADIYKLKNLHIYENGIMSLNPEINNSRTTTKSTHPKTIYLLNNILNDLNINIQIIHEFMFKTKAQMIGKLNEDFVLMIKSTNTCGMSRQNPKFDHSDGKQCGACVSCLLRKISMAYNDFEYYDVEYDIPYDYDFKTNHDLMNEYKSSLIYYKLFRNNILNGEIHNILNLKEKYFTDIDYKKKIQNMLNQFAAEIERFLDKYDL